jgi:hypothetical protein
MKNLFSLLMKDETTMTANRTVGAYSYTPLHKPICHDVSCKFEMILFRSLQNRGWL